MFDRLTKGVAHVLEITIVVCLALMSVLVFGNVVMRYAFDSGIAWSEELARLLFVWLIFLGAILASREHMHIGFDSLVRRLPDRWKKLCLSVSGTLMLACCVFFIIGGWQQVQINLGNSYPVLGISYAWLYATAIVFGVGMAISIVYNLYDALLRGHVDEELVLTRNIGERIKDEMITVAHGHDASRIGSRP